jgi:DNA-binding transcriptional LysR family regulator
MFDVLAGTKTVDVPVKVSVDDAAVLSKRLHKGEIDFCVASPRPFSSTELVHEHMYDNPFVVFASANHRVAKRKQLSIADLAGEQWASISNPQQQGAFRVFETNGLPLPPIALDTNCPVVRLSAIAYSDYLGLTSREFLRQEARRYPLAELPVKELANASTVSIIYRKGAYLSPAARRMIEILKAQAKEISAGERGPRRAG